MSITHARPIGLILIICVLIAVVLISRHDDKTKVSEVTDTPVISTDIRYLALGDSYTIGESVRESERWPNQLIARLQHDGVSIGIVGNPSVTGYTSQDLIDHELPLLKTLKPNFVTVLIGVNDYVQGVGATTFQKNLTYILDTVQAQLPGPKQLVLVTIPDYGKTPTGAHYGKPSESEAGIERFNAIILLAAEQRGLRVADVFPVSKQVVSDSSLTARDGLHPSAKQYALWTDQIYPLAKELLESSAKN